MILSILVSLVLQTDDMLMISASVSPADPPKRSIVLDWFGGERPQSLNVQKQSLDVIFKRTRLNKLHTKWSVELKRTHVNIPAVPIANS